MSSWQPIETVPYDGKPVLVWLEKSTHVHKSQVEVGLFHPNVTIIGSLFHFDQPKATHWMPLPEGPTQETFAGQPGFPSESPEQERSMRRDRYPPRFDSETGVTDA